MHPQTRIRLRDRFLREQQMQLTKDARLSDPAHAYRVLVERLEAEDDRRTIDEDGELLEDERPERAA